MKLWKASGLEDQSASALCALVESYTVGSDWVLDLDLARWDVLASIAHATMLEKIGILSSTELANIQRELKEVLDQIQLGKFSISPQDEDCHTAIENYLTKKLGDAGKKIHSGRSRNDQVLVAIKLFSKDAAFSVTRAALALAQTLLDFAQKHPHPLPGYTHMQKAMPSSLPLWSASFAESLLDDCAILLDTVELADSSPLGSAASYGTSLPLDRRLTAELLGFARVQGNVMYCQNSRGKNEAGLLSALSMFMLDLSKLASDVIFFSQPELGYLRIPEEFCTGSSIMPQKKNPDVLELLRAKARVLAALHAQVLQTCMALPSGYHRDFQMTKEPLLKGFEIAQASVQIMNELVAALDVDVERCRQALTPEIFSTDIANKYVAEGMPFRDAYRKVKEEIPGLSREDLHRFLGVKTHDGAPDDPKLLQTTQARHLAVTNRLAQLENPFRAAMAALAN
ncbi:MAG: argininosuccinate lyase [Deltaproteobacteria bacterium]|nr:argininosuccinate lyase [Deltaproteobacteria bacterium]